MLEHTIYCGAYSRARWSPTAREVALNVAEDSSAAIAVYRRLGCAVHMSYWKGHGTLL